MDGASINVTAEAAQVLAAPVEDAKRKARTVHEYEATLVHVHDKLRAAIAALDTLTQSDAVSMKMDAADASILFGVACMLEEIAEDCHRAYWR